MKRGAASAATERAFERRVDALDDIFAFTREAFTHLKIDPSLLLAIDFTIEELFTNMVKYSKMSHAAVDVAIGQIAGGVEVTLTDHDVDPFDLTQAPDVDVHKPIGERAPGGLGLHLIRRMVDSIEYEHDRNLRRSRIRFRKTLPGRHADGDQTNKGE